MSTIYIQAQPTSGFSETENDPSYRLTLSLFGLKPFGLFSGSLVKLSESWAFRPKNFSSSEI